MSEEKNTPSQAKLHWEPLGIWNIYFLFKFGLFYFSFLELHILENLALIAFLVLPTQHTKWHKIKHGLGIVAALLLLHFDSYLPPLSLLYTNQNLLASFSLSYLIEIALRIISWQVLAWMLVATVSYLYLNPWVRFTSVNIVLLLLSTWIVGNKEPNQANQTFAAAPATTNNTSPATQERIVVNSPDDALKQFYAEQRGVMTTFPSQFKGPDFDIIMLNICSLSWDDLSHIGLDNHPFMNQFDVLFTQFNSATSYSGPAATRLLNASCGHLPHDDLYGNKPKQCNLFGQLEQLGFQTDFAMNHNGFFDNFLQIIQTQGGISAPLQSLDKVKVIQRSFDGSPIYSDSQVLAQWLKKREQTQAPRHALYFNSISLHDGNLIADKPAGFDSMQSYGSRTQTLFNDLDGFFKSLTKTGKNYLVVMVPEHGAALKGDRMQFSGLREIPSPSIINVPVGIKFIGPSYKVKQKTIVSSEPVSYLALSELLARVNQTNPFESPSNLATLLSGLPTTPVVAENSGVKMLMYSGQPYVQLDNGEWQRYPN